MLLPFYLFTPIHTPAPAALPVRCLPQPRQRQAGHRRRCRSRSRARRHSSLHLHQTRQPGLHSEARVNHHRQRNFQQINPFPDLC